MLAWLTVMSVAVLSAGGMTVGEVELISEGHNFTEGPLWIPGSGLIFSDVPEDTIYHEDKTVFRKPSGNTNGMALDPQGRLIACESGRGHLTRTEKMEK